MRVPFVDLVAQFREIEGEVWAGFREVFESGRFVLGRNLEKFEYEFAQLCEAEFCVGVGSGTDALHLALRALGVEEGDEVIVPSFTFIGTVEAVWMAGAKVKFVDIEEETYTLDVDALEYAITQRTKAIIPVHLYGHPARMDRIMEMAEKYGFFVIEDAAQAHGAKFEDKMVGAIGDVGCFSFYVTKNLSACGEAGAVVTGRADLAEKVRLLRNHGQKGKYHHAIMGFNSRLDELQAVVLRAKLRKLDEWNERRRRIASIYNDAFAELPIILPYEAEWAWSVYHLYVVRFERRDELAQFLGKEGVATAIHYPKPCHLQEACREFGYREGSLPVSERVAGQVLALPLYPQMSESQVEYVIEKVREFFGR